MPSPDSDHEQRWEALAAELQAYREGQQACWGFVSDLTVARFLADECTPRERDSVENAMREHEAVRDSIEVLRELVAIPDLIPQAAAESVMPKTSESIWRLVDRVAELADRLRVWIDEAGATAASGLPSLLDRPRLALAHLGDELEIGQTWNLPLGDTGAEVRLHVRPSTDDGWELKLSVAGADPASINVRIAEEIGRILYRGSLRNLSSTPVNLNDGQWQIELHAEAQVFRLSLQLDQE